MLRAVRRLKEGLPAATPRKTLLPAFLAGTSSCPHPGRLRNHAVQTSSLILLTERLLAQLDQDTVPRASPGSALPESWRKDSPQPRRLSTERHCRYPISQMRKLRHQEIRHLPKGHAAVGACCPHPGHASLLWPGPRGGLSLVSASQQSFSHGPGT